MMRSSYFFLIGLFFTNILAQSTNHTVLHNGLIREYRLYVPALYDGATPVPLVFNLHGYTSDNLEQEFYGDFRPIADTANFILVHPNGTFDLSGNRWWNAFGGPGPDDVGFISSLIDEIAGDYAIDLNRVYSCGMSNGGFMSYELACALSHRITAVASVTGSMPKGRFATCNPSKPIPAMQIHGTMDATVPYNGNAQFEGVEDVVDFWRNQVGASAAGVYFPWPDLDPNDGCTAEWFIYENATNSASVEFFKVSNGGHTWPGAPITIGVTNQDFSASEQIWRFFSQYSADQLANLEEAPPAIAARVYPNPSEGIFIIESAYALHRAVVCDMMGRVVQSIELDGSLQIELEIDRKGVYLIRLASSVGEENFKVIVN